MLNLSWFAIYTAIGRLNNETYGLFLIFRSTAAHTSLTGAAVSSAPSPTWTIQADSDTSQRSHSPTKAAIIAGTLAGVFALLVIAILGVLFVIRRNKKRLDHIRQILETTAVPYNPTARGSLSSEASSGGNMVEVRD